MTVALVAAKCVEPDQLGRTLDFRADIAAGTGKQRHRLHRPCPFQTARIDLSFYVEDRPWCDCLHLKTIRGMPISSPRHAQDPALIALGRAIREARRERGISQEELAHRSEMDRSYMSSIERGGQNPGVMSVVRIAQALDMTMTELMAEAEL